MGGWEKFQKQKEKKKLGGGRAENKVPPKKNRDQGKNKLGRGRGENKVAEKNWDQGWERAEKGQTKKVNLIWHKDRKENPPISAPSIHVGALVGAGLLWPTLAHTVALTFPLTSILMQNKN